jgi:hypothetical protein
LEALRWPSVFYSVDTHHHHAWHRVLGQLFDLTLVAQKDYLWMFTESGCNAAWFPLWVSRTVTPSETRDVSASFRGTLDGELHPQRAEFFARLAALVPIDAAGGDIAIYGQSKIVVNEAVKGDLNFRVFEAMAAGALLVTPQIGNGLLELFTAGEHLITYTAGNAEEVAEKVQWFLNHDEKRAEIARRGQQEVLAKHTAAARAKELLALSTEMKRCARRRKEISAARVFLSNVEALRAVASPFAKPLLWEAGRLLFAGASEGLDSEATSLIILTKYFLEEEGLADEAWTFVVQFLRTHPDDLILQLSAIDELLRRGCLEEARALAEIVSPHPAEFLESIPRLLADVRERIAHPQID